VVDLEGYFRLTMTRPNYLPGGTWSWSTGGIGQDEPLCSSFLRVPLLLVGLGSWRINGPAPHRGLRIPPAGSSMAAGHLVLLCRIVRVVGAAGPSWGRGTLTLGFIRAHSHLCCYRGHHWLVRLILLSHIAGLVCSSQVFACNPLDAWLVLKRPEDLWYTCTQVWISSEVLEVPTLAWSYPW
jgi:hypothetical protein